MFNKQNFCHVASNNRNEQKAGLFVYKTTDDLATVATSGYFNEKIIDINLHDLIIHEWHNPTDRTKVQRNVLCVVERTLDNVGTIVIKSKWEGDIEQAIADLQTYVEQNFVNIDGSSVMTGPLKFSAGSMRGAVAGGLNGLMFFKMDSEGNLTQIGSLSDTQFVPASDNTLDIGTSVRKVERIYLGKINNGYDIDVPVTNSADTMALKSQVDDAANSGEQLYTTGVWYAKMYSATTVPTGAEYEGRNYADFSQVDGNNDPIIVVYTYTSGAWTQTAVINPPKNHNGYMTITSKIWDIAEQAGQQGGLVLWAHNQETFTPYPRIVSFDGANITNSTLTNCIANMPVNPTGDSIVNVDYLATHNGTCRNVGDIFLTERTDTGLNGAVETNGGTYDGTDFTGSQSPVALMEAGKLPYVSLSTYASTIASQGWCDKFGWDGAGTTTFRVPTLNAYIWQKLTSAVKGSVATLGDFADKGPVVVPSNAEMGFFQKGNVADACIKDKVDNLTLTGIVADATDSVSDQRVMVQLAISATDEAVMTCTAVTAQVAANTTDVADLKDASNFTSTGKTNIVNMAMPSDSYEEITVLSSGGQYTAPADGYVSIHATATGGGGTYVELVSDTSPEFGCSQQAAFNGVMRLCMPVAKNSTYRFWYNGSPTINHFRFYYAIGTKPVI